MPPAEVLRDVRLDIVVLHVPHAVAVNTVITHGLQHHEERLSNHRAAGAGCLLIAAVAAGVGACSTADGAAAATSQPMQHPWPLDDGRGAAEEAGVQSTGRPPPHLQPRPALARPRV